jgi:Uma2 family endonuclease
MLWKEGGEAMAIVQRPKEITTTVPADWVPGPPQGSWTYDAYAALPDDGKRYEIAQGVLIMTPAPEPGDQRISREISFCLYEHIMTRKLGEVLYAPVDVVLSEEDTFQPDVLVILNEHLERIQEKLVAGAPDLVVEIISPGSLLNDRVTKKLAYERAGIPEYWLVDPEKKTVEVFVLENGAYTSLGLFKGEQQLQSRIVPEMSVPVAHFF